MEKRIAIMRTRCIHATAEGKCNYCDGLSMNCHGDTCPNYEREPYSNVTCVTKSLHHPERRTIMNKIYNLEDYCAPTLAEQMADVDFPWEIVPAGFHRIQHYYGGDKYFYVARKLDPRIVTYCAHVKGAKALNLPF